MPRLARIVAPGHPHHITQRGSRRQRTFFEAADYRAYLDILISLKTEADVDILAYCLMPNHVHFIAVPNDAHGLSRLFGTAHHRYARRVNEIHDWRGHLWQERFHSFVMDESHFLSAVRYVESNPVRAGLCRHAADWQWSSARSHTGMFVDPLLAESTLLEGIRDWNLFLDGNQAGDEFDILRSHTRTGRPAGSEEFLEELEESTGRRLRRMKPGPKPRPRAIALRVDENAGNGGGN